MTYLIFKYINLTLCFGCTGCQSVKCSVLKNGHVFNVHLLNPKDVEENESNPELEAEVSPTKISENSTPVSLGKKEKLLLIYYTWKREIHI